MSNDELRKIAERATRECWESSARSYNTIILGALEEAYVHGKAEFAGKLTEALIDLDKAEQTIADLRRQLEAAKDNRDRKDYFPFTPKDWPT